MKTPKLHTQIFLALVLGALFGAYFHVDQTKVIVSYQHQAKTREVVLAAWQQLELRAGGQTQVCTPREVTKLLKTWNALPAASRESAVLLVTRAQGAPQEFQHLVSLRKETTVATALRPLGAVFIRLLNLIAVPLVLASLLVGAASLGDIRKVARLGAKSLTYFMTTTALAITIGLVLANTLRPGERISATAKELLLAEYRTEVQGKLAQEVTVNVVDMLVRMVPTNPFSALATGDMLQIVFFAVVTGIMLTFVKREKAIPVIAFFDGVSETMIALVQVVMKIAPYAVFALIAATVSEFGFEILQTLVWYTLCVLLGLLLHTTLVYPAFLKTFSRMPLRTFFKGIRPAQLVAFSTSSSAATLPVNMECCEDNLGVPKHVTSFVLPLGATINMDGTALYQGVAAVFIAQVYGFDLSPVQQLTIVLTATLASIGTAPVPGVGIIMLILVLKAIHVPEEGIALIMGVDRFLDMCRTVPNITGDATGAVIMAAGETRRAERQRQENQGQPAAAAV